MSQQLVSLEEVLALKAVLWPTAMLYDKQIEIVESTLECKETYVVAGNQLGKDWVAGFICLTSFLVCYGKGVRCRIVTTSIAEHHLKVLWGEIGRFVTTSTRPLLVSDGGLLVINHQEIRRVNEAAAKNPDNYLIGRVSAKGEGLAGHHSEWNLFVGDEASGIDDVAYEMAQGWAKHMLIFGNPNQCSGFFKKGVERGNIAA